MEVKHTCGKWFEFFDTSEDEDINEEQRLYDFVVYTEQGEQLFEGDVCPKCDVHMKREEFIDLEN